MKENKSEIMRGIESVKSKIVANNTIEYYRENGDRVIRLHHTDIITFKVNGDIVLNSGGWLTSTTKGRMNAFLPPHVKTIYQNRGSWFIDGKIFKDGLTIHPDGTMEGYEEDEKKNETVA